MVDLVLAPTEEMAPPERAELARLRADAMPEETRRAYSGAWKRFCVWCAGRKLTPLPASGETLARYILYLDRERRRTISTARVAIAAIHAAHLKKKHASARYETEVLEALKGMGRRQAGRPLAHRAALTPELLGKLVAAQGTDLRGARDRAILLVGFCTAMRRSEIVSIQVEDISFQKESATIVIRKSKTDQQGLGATVPLYRSKNEAMCPVRALATWIGLSGIRSGPVFRKVDVEGHVWKRALESKYVYDLVKEGCRKAGVDPKPFGAHSLRAGFVTAASKAGATLDRIATTTRHRDLNVLRRYVRDADALKSGVGKGLLD